VGQIRDSLTRAKQEWQLSNQLPKFRVPQPPALRSFDELHFAAALRLGKEAIGNQQSAIS
jgi:hypothetical protein